MHSLWMKDNQAPGFDQLKGTVETDTLIIGGGLAGILCAFFLKERGVDCLVLEAGRIGSGTTGNTTAKITAQHGLIYAKIERGYGLNAAKAYLRANQEAVDEFRRLSGGIACDFAEKTAYMYSRENRKKLEEEAETYRKMGLPPVLTERPAIPVKTVGALGMERQAQFHPMKFLSAVAGGLRIYENSFVREVRPGLAVTEQGRVRAKNIVLATHYPMLNLRGLYFMKLYQHRSYVLALTGAEDPGAMYLDEQEGGLSFRSQQDCLLLGGGSHRTGKQGGGWEALYRVAKTAYPGAQTACAWAAQDCMSLDGIPYIGRQLWNSRGMFVATGFNKWGMTGAMVAARVLCGLITEGGSRDQELFDPARSMLRPQLLANMASSVFSLLTPGKRCPHMGCALKWNPQEHSWDCPCHGSRFDRHGSLLDNPAKRDIRPK